MKRISANLLKHMINLWPPFLGTGIHVDKISNDFTYAKISMKLKFYNRNYFGTQFGGNLYAMTDPSYPIFLFHQLGKNYYIYDKSGHIEYIAPGKGKVFAEFSLSQQQLTEIYQKTDNGDKLFYDFIIDIIDQQKQLIAKVTKTVYIRKKPRVRS